MDNTPSVKWCGFFLGRITFIQSLGLELVALFSFIGNNAGPGTGLLTVVRNHLTIESNVRPNSLAISAFPSSVGFGFSEISLCNMVISSFVYLVKVPVAVFS